MDWDKEFGLLDLLDLIKFRFVFIKINKNKVFDMKCLFILDGEEE